MEKVVLTYAGWCNLRLTRGTNFDMITLLSATAVVFLVIALAAAIQAFVHSTGQLRRFENLYRATNPGPIDDSEKITRDDRRRPDCVR